MHVAAHLPPKIVYHPRSVAEGLRDDDA